jgi:hypothetical protein
MPVTKTVLKKTPQTAVVKLVGAGTATIDLDGDLKTADETFLGYANANVNISGIIWTLGGTDSITIARNSTTTLVVYGNDNWTFNQQYGFTDTSNNTANLAFTFSGSGGTAIITLSKTQGYTLTNQQVLYSKYD